jgi:hypothetical protein
VDAGVLEESRDGAVVVAGGEDAGVGDAGAGRDAGVGDAAAGRDAGGDGGGFGDAGRVDAGSVPAPVSLDFTLERVRYCVDTVLGICSESVSPEKFRFWDEREVPRDHQKKTYLGVLLDPGPEAAEHVVLLVAGQNQGRGVDSVVTGQREGYEEGCDGTTPSCPYRLTPESLAARALSSGLFPPERTFFAVVFNAQFNFEHAERNRVRVLAAFTDWVREHARLERLRGIYLGGASRGGCMAMRLAKAWREEQGCRQVPITVHSFDGVCDKGIGELGTTGESLDNPLPEAPSGYRAWKTDLVALYGDPLSLAIRQLVGGDEVVPLSGARGFTDFRGNLAGLEMVNAAGHPWYSQQWTSLCHTCIGRDYANVGQTVEPMLTHLREAAARFHCTGGMAWDGAAGACACPAGTAWRPAQGRCG